MATNGSRTGLGKRLRYEILRRDNYTCRYCGGFAPNVVLTVDHVVPVVLGGSDDPTNLVTACVDCNAGKSSVNPESEVVEDVSDSALLYARAVTQVAQVRAQEYALTGARVLAFSEYWDTWTCGGRPLPLPDDWRNSIRLFSARNLTSDAMRTFVDKAMSGPVPPNGKWTHFCKLCWNEINTIHEMALEVISNGQVE